MTTDELKAKHFWNVQLADKYSHLLREDETYLTDNHAYLSIQFTLEVLEECLNKYTPEENIKAAIKQLKQYLDEKV